MLTYDIAYSAAMALLIGLLIGVEREHSQAADEPLFAGIRTFPVITLIGYSSGLIAQANVLWPLPMALAAVGALSVASYMAKVRGAHKGATTEFVAILAFLLGALVAFKYTIPAATFAVITTLILSMKAPLHHFAQKIRKEELFSILKFGIVAVIVLPLLPNQSYGPFQSFNPRIVWWMVVLISAISMIGYILMRFWGAKRGIAMTGALGGIVSSTAVTVGLSQKARISDGSAASHFAIGIAVASTIMFVRVLLLTVVINPALGRYLAWPIALPALIGIVSALVLWKHREAQAEAGLEVKNPMELGRAIQFAVLFAVVVFLSKAAHRYFGAAGIYATSILAGMTDVDAIAISSSRLALSQELDGHTASASILLACAMNTMVKGIIAATTGGPALRPYAIRIFGALSLGALGAGMLFALL